MASNASDRRPLIGLTSYLERVQPRPGSRMARLLGTVEAVEMPGRRFILGVQWHPEQDSADPRLFNALIAAARQRSGEHGGTR